MSYRALLAACVLVLACGPAAAAPSEPPTPLDLVEVDGHGRPAAGAWRGSAAGLARAGAWPELAAAGQAQAAQHPERASGWFVVGHAELRLGRPAAAAVAFEQVVQRSPGFYRGWAGLAEAYHTAGDRPALASVFDRLRLHSPQMALDLVRALFSVEAERHRALARTAPAKA